MTTLPKLTTERPPSWPANVGETTMQPCAATPWASVVVAAQQYGLYGVAHPVSGDATARRELEYLQHTAAMLVATVVTK